LFVFNRQDELLHSTRTYKKGTKKHRSIMADNEDDLVDYDEEEVRAIVRKTNQPAFDNFFGSSIG
jgi:cytochrome c553